MPICPIDLIPLAALTLSVNYATQAKSVRPPLQDERPAKKAKKATPSDAAAAASSQSTHSDGGVQTARAAIAAAAGSSSASDAVVVANAGASSDSNTVKQEAAAPLPGKADSDEEVCERAYTENGWEWRRYVIISDDDD